jgi:fructose-bisphosphate aldolase class II
VIRKEIALSIRECMNHELIDGFLVSHGSSLVPFYIVNAINKYGGNVNNAHGISLEQLKEVSLTGINKINVDTDLRLAVTRNVRELFNTRVQLKNNASIGEIWQLMEQKPENFDPRYYLTPIMNTLQFGTSGDEYIDLIVKEMKMGVKEVLGTLIVEFGAVGKAELVKEVTLEQMADFYKTNKM